MKSLMQIDNEGAAYNAARNFEKLLGWFQLLRRDNWSHDRYMHAMYNYWLGNVYKNSRIKFEKTI